jgi:hypothetical protein
MMTPATYSLCRDTYFIKRITDNRLHVLNLVSHCYGTRYHQRHDEVNGPLPFFSVTLPVGFSSIVLDGT